MTTSRFTALRAAAGRLLPMVAAVLLAVGGPAAAEPGFWQVHGNWCGPGNRWLPGVGTLPPIDVLDAACMRHDACYAWRGDGDCSCDHAFLDELRVLPYGDPHQWVKGRAIYDATSLMPCAGPEAMTKPAWFMGQLFDDAVAGGPPPWEVPRRMLYTLDHPW